MAGILEQLDTLTHDVTSFSSGIAVCDEDLLRQSRKPRKLVYVIAGGQRIFAFGRYSYVVYSHAKTKSPLVRIDFIARDQVYGRGAGRELLLQLFVAITNDAKAIDCKGVLIDSLNCGDETASRKRWALFLGFGFQPLQMGGKPFGYAFMPMKLVNEIAAATASRG